MRNTRALPVLLSATLLTAATATGEQPPLPWREAGLTERQAAAHLLDRFAFGARPGDVDRVVTMGLAAWLERQLAADLADPEIERRLAGFRSLELSTREAVETYPNPGMVLREAAQAGVIDREGFERQERTEMADGRDPERAAQRRELMEYARRQGYRPMRELIGELMVAKLLRARYGENQLREVLTDFWFNHFNVSITDNDSRPFVPAYERDAIRPHVLGDFRQMLEATAKHPAMLLYLDNARSVGEEGSPKTFDRVRAARARDRGRFGRGGGGRGRPGRGRPGDEERRQAAESRRPKGLNENYARELMELHTLGVDGGYTQDDVVAVARAFSGWTTYPPGPARRWVDRHIERARRFPEAGFVFEESFIFRADAHDAGKKTILDKTYPAGRGIEDGLDVLDDLARHRSTARHLATKLAARFVTDEPPASLVDRLAARFSSSGGDLEAVMRELAWSREFWSPEARGAKIKSPFELTVSALRALDADVTEPRGTVEWIRRMGQPLYAYQAPTGYPDRAEAWVNTGSLLSRMNFGLQLATGRVPGVEFDLLALNGHREPESAGDALSTYVPLLLPERDPAETIRRLEPVIRDPELAKRIEEASPADEGEPADDDWDPGAFAGGRGRGPGERRPPVPVEIDSSPLAHVVGVILGSPEFQRR